MAKFTSIWGDLEVGSVQKAATSEKEPKDKDVNPDGTAAEVDDNKATEVVEEESTKGEEAAKDVTGAEEEEEEEIDYSDEDVSKAFTMLTDEGVLDLTDDDDFDMSTSGLADAVAATVRNKLSAEISAIPDSVQQYYAHIMEGKDPNKFAVQTETNWDEVNLDEDGNKEAALLQFYVNQGMSQDDAQEEVEDIVAAGKLDKKAEVARDSLVTVQKGQATAKAEAQKAAAAKAEAERVAEVDAVEKSIDDATTLAGFTLDDKRKKEFKAYLFKVKPRTGKTQMQENMSSEDRRLTLAFLDFVEYTKADLEKAVATDLTKKRKKKLTRFTDKGLRNKSSSSVSTKTKNKSGKIKFPTIFGSSSVESED